MPGVRPDRGELDKTVERSSTSVPQLGRDSYRKEDDGYRGRDDRAFPRKKRGSVLGELFDFLYRVRLFRTVKSASTSKAKKLRNKSSRLTMLTTRSPRCRQSRGNGK